MEATGNDIGTITLHDGDTLHFRPILPTDLVALQRFHARLSDRSVYQRFFAPRPWLSDRQAHHFTNVDGINRVALVALDPLENGELAGVVRFDRDPGQADEPCAEYAAVIADRWQRRGLGLALTHRVIAAARKRGIRTLYAYVLPDNDRMLNLLRDLGLPERITFEDTIERVDVFLGHPVED